MAKIQKYVLLIVALALILAGCSSKSNSNSGSAGSANSPSSTAPAKPIALNFPTWQATDPVFKDWLTGLVAEFQKQHPNVTVNMNYVPFKNYTDYMTAQFAANQAPDIVQLPSANFSQFASQGWLAPLDTYIQQTDVPKKWTSLQKSMEWDGHTEGVLLLGYGFNLYYNEKMLKDAGVSVPKTPQELIDAAKKLKKNEVYGFGMSTIIHPNVYNDASEFVIGEGQNWVKNGQYNMTDPQVVKALNDYRELAKYSPKGISAEQKRQLFFDGKIAMMIDGPFVYAQRKSAAADIAANIKVAPAPFPVSSGLVSNNLSMPASISADKKDLVADFIKLAASPTWQSEYAKQTGSPPPMEGAVTPEIASAHPELSIFSEVAKSAVNIIPDSKNIQANYNQYSNLVINAMVQLFTTNDPTDQVLSALQTKLNATVKP